MVAVGTKTRRITKFTAVFVRSDGDEEILREDVSRDTAYYACIRHYYGPL